MSKPTVVGRLRPTATRCAVATLVSCVVCAGPHSVAPSPITWTVRAAGQVVTSAESTGATNRPGESLRDCVECPELVVLPAGDFDMGAPAG